MYFRTEDEPFEHVIGEIRWLLRKLRKLQREYDDTENMNSCKTGEYPSILSEEWDWINLADEVPKTGRVIVFQHNPLESTGNEKLIESLVGEVHSFNDEKHTIEVCGEQYGSWSEKAKWRYYTEGELKYDF